MEFCQATLKIRFEKSIGGIVQKKAAPLSVKRLLIIRNIGYGSVKTSFAGSHA